MKKIYLLLIFVFTLCHAEDSFNIQKEIDNSIKKFEKQEISFEELKSWSLKKIKIYKNSVPSMFQGTITKVEECISSSSSKENLVNCIPDFIVK